MRGAGRYRALSPRDSVTIASGGTAAASDDVRDQNREVDRPHEALAREAHRADLRVIHDIADQKERRGDEGRDHHRAVLRDPPRADQHVADEQQDARQARSGWR